MNNARRIARQLHYTGSTKLNPSTEESEEIRDKYGLEVPYRSSFNSEVDDFLSGEEDGEDKYLSGKYIVTKVRQKMLGNNGDTSTTIMECGKDTGIKV